MSELPSWRGNAAIALAVALSCALLSFATLSGCRGPAPDRIEEPGAGPAQAAGNGVDPRPSGTGNGDPGRPAGAPARGKWRTARAPLHPAARPGPSETEKLLANPYLQGYRSARPLPLVTVHDPSAAQPGVNLYVSGHDSEALLVDMEGRLLHRWRYELRRLWPDLYRGDLAQRVAAVEYWRRAALLPDGSLLAIFEGLGLVKLDRDSRLQWAYRSGAHHDLEVAADGTIWLLDRRLAALPEVAGGREILEDLVTVLSPDGEVIRQISIPLALARSHYAHLLADLPTDRDVLHTNTLELLPATPLAAPLPAFRAGNLLLSLHTVDTVAVLDPDREEVVWALSGLWRRQHQPTLLPGGHLLVFDNGGAGLASRVLEVDPLTQELAWAWPPRRDPAVLDSRTLGSCQRLPNGNTLVTESENGRALELTAGGRIVWEFHSPHRAGERGELVATLFEVLRLPADQPWLARR